ncbi:MAG: hypothetical protein DRZ80_06630, partial [Thermoprotei archaeon]
QNPSELYDLFSAFRFHFTNFLRVCEFRATIIVLRDIEIAPIAGVNNISALLSTPATDGIVIT